MGIPDYKFQHYAFNAGENKGDAPTFFSKSELDRSWNIENRGNGLTTRNGSTPLNVDSSGFASPLAGNPIIHNIFGHVYSSTFESFFTAGDSIYKDVDTPTAIKTDLTSGLNFQGQAVEDLFYFVNGTDTNQYFDPDRSITKTFNVGYDVPSAFTATPVVGGGNMAAGTYSYYVTLFDENTDTESLRQDTAVTAVVVGPNDRVTLSNLPLDSEDRTSHWKIYRLDPTGYYHYLLDTIPYNAGSPTYTDDDATTGENFIAPTDNDRPEPAKGICLHENLMVYFSGDTFTWSKRFRFQNVPTYNRESLKDTSTEIVKMVSFRKALFIWKTDSIYVVIGDLNSDYVVHKISTTTGTESPDTVCEGPTGIFFIDSQRRPQFIDSTDFNAEDLRPSADISYKYRKKFEMISESSLPNCHAVLWQTPEVSQYRVYVPIEGSTHANHCYVYDIGLAAQNGGDSAWFDFDLGQELSCSCVAKTSTGTYQLRAGDTYGIVWRLEVPEHFYDGPEFAFRSEGEGTLTIGATTIDVSTFTMDVNAFVGVKLRLYDQYTYNELFSSRVVSNSATQFVVEDTIVSLETDDPAISVGGYLSYFATSHFTHDRAGRNRPFAMSLLFSTEFYGSSVQFFTHYDFNQAFNYTYEYINEPSNESLTDLADNYTIQLSGLDPVYDSPTALYDVSRYGISTYGTDDFLLNSKYLFNHVSWGIISREPNNPFSYLGATMFYQPKERASSRG